MGCRSSKVIHFSVWTPFVHPPEEEVFTVWFYFKKCLQAAAERHLLLDLCRLLSENKTAHRSTLSSACWWGKTPSKQMTGVLNCVSSNSLWELDLLVSYLSLKRKRSDSPWCVCGAAEKARPASAPSIPSIFSTLIFYGEPARTAPDTNAPSDRLDECELIGLMIFLPHFPPLHGCSMVHGADGWNQLPHTHTSYLTSMVPTSPAHWEEDAHKLLCIH